MNIKALDAAFADLETAVAQVSAANDRLESIFGHLEVSTDQPLPSLSRLNTMKVTLTSEVRAVLERSTITADAVTLPPEQLPNYKQVNAVLEAAGGKWNRKARCHLFSSDPREALGLALQTGQIIHKEKARKKERQAFYTPSATANTVACLADIDGHLVLEPNAGGGELAAACLRYGATNVHCIEIDADAASALPYPAIKADFLQCLPRAPDVPPEFRRLYTRIVMNPPFTRKSDCKHVMHAFAHWLAIGGILTAIVCDDNFDRPDILAALRGSGATYTIKERLPAGTFKESGTMISTLVIQLSK